MASHAETVLPALLFEAERLLCWRNGHVPEAGWSLAGRTGDRGS